MLQRKPFFTFPAATSAALTRPCIPVSGREPGPQVARGVGGGATTAALAGGRTDPVRPRAATARTATRTRGRAAMVGGYVRPYERPSRPVGAGAGGGDPLR